MHENSLRKSEILIFREKEATGRGATGVQAWLGRRSGQVLVNVGQLTRDDVTGFSVLCRARVDGRGKRRGRNEWKRDGTRGGGCSPARRESLRSGTTSARPPRAGSLVFVLCDSTRFTGSASRRRLVATFCNSRKPRVEFYQTPVNASPGFFRVSVNAKKRSWSMREDF